MPDFSESITVAAPPAEVYAQVSDLARMGEWSPECTRVSWATAGPPVVGARFIGYNRVGLMRWFTQGEVVEAVPGERFSFRIRFGPVPIALWSYDFTPAPGGCLVTESWTDRRPGALRTVFAWFFGDRAERNRRGIRQTLGNLKSSLEPAS
ncbi:SRPBCC family protein [Kribbella sp. CA-293567]|uniref:SRPBCC family protein n=1 Tax=Kribbella sp. CA-293567 TaxID=3002436 RepID=UPI0022DE88F7|nr:SRPBCC family protein [Kribbella sp. CA-293567]WBQ03181.1 SRPBCC family protein [Kribbella sp. CA-293567]